MTRLLLVICLFAGCITAPPDAQPERDGGNESDLGSADMRTAQDVSAGVDLGGDAAADMAPDLGPQIFASAVTSRLDALWLFEKGAPDGDSVGNHSLNTIEGVVEDSVDAVEGAGLLSLLAGQTATGAAADPIVTAASSTSFVAGGWFREKEFSSSTTFLSRYEFGVGGWAMTLVAGEVSPTCIAHSMVGGDKWTSSLGPVDRAVWNHYACMFEIDADGIANTTMFINGEIVAQAENLITSTETSGGGMIPFKIGSDNLEAFAFAGHVDEVFVAEEAVEQRAIRKLWSCGANGERCLCDPEDTTKYADCGLIADCTRLPNCR